jgi:DNA-binding GntR family transcriptional regulator
MADRSRHEDPVPRTESAVKLVDKQPSAADALAIEELAQQPPLRERARDSLERLIVSGAYQPGEHLVETTLAKQLGVSRGPVREALYMLQLQGWVDLRPRQGAFVHAPSIEEVDQFFQVRVLLETEVSSRVAGNVEPQDVDLLREQIAGARQAVEDEDEAKLVEGNAAFHGYIHRLAGNPVLVELVETLDKRLRWYFAPVAMERARDAWDEHEALVGALAEGDRARAVAITRSHNERTRQAYVRHRRLQADGDPAVQG